jgi:hypothetical protein
LSFAWPLVAGGLWAAVQGFLTVRIVDERPATLACVEMIPRTELAVAALATGLAFAVALVAAGLRARRVTAGALAAEAIAVVAWIVIGGFGALSCVIAI